MKLLKEVMPLVGDRNDIAVDDDHGSILLGRQFNAMLQESSALRWLSQDYET